MVKVILGIVLQLLMSIANIFQKKGKLPPWLVEVLEILNGVLPILSVSNDPKASLYISRINQVKGKYNV